MADGLGILAAGTTLLVLTGILNPWWLLLSVPWLAFEFLLVIIALAD